jgi:hypothetical protein
MADDQGAREALVEQLAEAIAVGKANAALTGESPLGELLDVVEEHVAAEVEAAVSVVRADLARHYEAHLADERRAYRALREGLEPLADEWESQVRYIPKSGSGVDEGVRAATRSDAAAIRRLLVPSPAERWCSTHNSQWPLAESRCEKGDPWDDGKACVSSPAEGTGEAIHDDGCAEWCNHCEVCGIGTPYGSRCPSHPSTGFQGS